MQRLNKVTFLVLFEILTVGLPFCAFKCTSGIFYLSQETSLLIRIFGAGLIIIGALDFFINGVNFFGVGVFRRNLLAACFFSAVLSLGRVPFKASEWSRGEIGKSLDVLLSFSLVAWVIGTGAIAHFPPVVQTFWNIGVILNVMGAGLMRFVVSLKHI